MRRCGPPLFLLVLVLGVPSASQAFICSRTGVDMQGNGTGPSLSWARRDLTYAVNKRGTAQIPFAAASKTLDQAFAVWQKLTLDQNSAAQCKALPGTDLTLKALPPTAATWIGYNLLDPNNNVNVLVFRDDVWTHKDDVGDIIALTTSTYSGATGQILDADIEFNSATFSFSTAARPPANATDLLNTAVHEVGHFLGLAHCGAAACGHQEVMEPTAGVGEVQKRALKCDDRAGLVFKYPAGKPNAYCSATKVDSSCGFCAPPEPVAVPPQVTTRSIQAHRGGCAAGAAGSPVALGLALGGLLGWRRRRAMRRLGTMALLICGTVSCSEPHCPGPAPTPGPESPMIVGMHLVGTVPSDPWRVVLAVDFVDYDGDLGAGSAQVFANGQSTVSTAPPLATLFSSSGGVELTATSGSFALPIRIADDTPDGAHLHLSTQLIDAAGNVSNCYELELRFNLFP